MLGALAAEAVGRTIAGCAVGGAVAVRGNLALCNSSAPTETLADLAWHGTGMNTEARDACSSDGVASGLASAGVASGSRTGG